MHRIKASASSVVLVVVVAACSAGSGSGPGTSGGSSGSSKLGGYVRNQSCTNTEISAPRTAKDATCDACGEQSCLTEQHAVLGPDPNGYGGACGATQQCNCDCRAADQTCETACEAKRTAECAQALRTMLECLAAKCKSSC